MGKKKSWFTCVKRLFIPEPKPRPEKKSKKWKWLSEKLKPSRYPAIEAPQKTLSEATEEQRKRALAVAVATAAAAEAAVAAANAAAQVVQLITTPVEIERRNQLYSAIKIQSAYRGHLARKALSALKGLVKLQAVVRGELLRRSLTKKLESISLSNKIHSQVHSKRVTAPLDYQNRGERRCSFSHQPEDFKLKCNTRRSWDCLESKESVENLCLRKQEAIARRERMKQYSFSHRERRNDQNLQVAMSYKLENRKTGRFKELEKTEPLLDTSEFAHLKLRTVLKPNMTEEVNSQRKPLAPRKQKPIGDDDGFSPNSLLLPTYMATTESAKAKSRSLSTPRQRLRLYDTYSGPSSPYKIKLSSWSSFNSETRNIGDPNSPSHQ